MGERKSYTPGTFCWIELATTDLEKAKVFYASLLGWSWQDEQLAAGQTYSSAMLAGHRVAGLYERIDAPPAWLTYASVAELKMLVSDIESLGGAVITPITAVDAAGSLAVIKDPSGVELGLWQPQGNSGAQLVNSTGAWAWSELNTDSVADAKRFYSAILAWDYSDMPSGKYTHILNAGRSHGAIRTGLRSGEAEHWLCYFAVTNCEKAVEEAKSLGATVVFKLSEEPGGVLSVLQDPQGATFALIKLRRTDE